MSSNDTLRIKPQKSEALESMKPTCVAFSKTQTLYLGLKEGFLRSHSSDDLSKQKLLKTSLSSVECLLVDSSDNIWVGGDSGDIQRYSSSEKLEVCLKGHNDVIVSIHLDSAEKILYSTSEDLTVRRWDLQTFENEILIETSEPIICADFKEVIQTLALCTSADELVVFNVLQPEKTKKINVESKIWSLRLADRRDWLIEGNAEGNLVIRNLNDLQQVKVLNGHESRVKCIGLNYDQTFAVSGSFDQMVFVWDLNHYCLKYAFEGPNDWVRGVAVHPEFTHVYSVSDDSQLCVWEIPKVNQAIQENIKFYPVFEFFIWILTTLFYYFGLHLNVRARVQILYLNVYNYSNVVTLKKLSSNICNYLKATTASLISRLSNLLHFYIQACINLASKLVIFILRFIFSIFMIFVGIPPMIYVKLRKQAQKSLHFN